MSARNDLGSEALGAAHYCLSCHSSLPISDGRTMTCAHCGHGQLASDFKRYWTRSPAVLRWMRRLRVVFIVLAVLTPLTLNLVGALTGDLALSLFVFFVPLVGLCSVGAYTRRTQWTPSRVWGALFIFAAGFELFQALFSLADLGWDEVLRLQYPLRFGGFLVLGLVLLWVARGAPSRRIAIHHQLHELAMSEDAGSDGSSPMLTSTKPGQCLKCFTVMDRNERNCPECAHLNLPSLRRVYWNQHPWILVFQRAAQVLVVGCAFVIFGYGVSGMSHFGVGSGWYLIAPFVFAYAVVMTLEKLTRHMPNFSPSMVWAISLPFSVLVISPIFLERVGHEDAASLALPMSLVVLIIVLIISRAFDGWKNRLRQRRV